jgi:hypothetical protein
MLFVAPPSSNSPSAGRKPRSRNCNITKEILSEKAFRRILSLEQKRSERTQRPFALLLMDTGRALPNENAAVLRNILSVLQSATRETDLMGWHETNVSVGVMLTEIMLENHLILSAILSRINATLRDKLSGEHFSQIKFSCDLYPEQLRRLQPVSETNGGLPLSYAASGTSGGEGLPPS